VEVSEQALENTAADLAHATSMLGSARELAQHGGRRAGSAAPQDPRPPRQDKRAAGGFARGRPGTPGCDCLLTIRHLLHHPFLPGLDGVIEHQRAQACGHLASAKDKVDACAALAARARDDVSAAAD
jgi:hypothetical protein